MELSARERVLKLAEEVFMSAEVAQRWYQHERPVELRGQTPAEVVNEGREDTVVRLLHLLDGGFLG